MTKKLEEIEEKYGSVFFIKLCLTSLNHLLVDKGIIEEKELLRYFDGYFQENLQEISRQLIEDSKKNNHSTEKDILVKTFPKDSIANQLNRKLFGIEALDNLQAAKIKKRAIKFVQKEFDKLNEQIKELESKNEKLKDEICGLNGTHDL